MRGKPVEVTLADGSKVEVPRVSPFGAPDGIAEKLRYLEDQTRGVTLDRLGRKIQRELGRADRLEKMSERCDAFIQHPDTPPEKRDEYFKKMESFNSQIEGALDNVEKAGNEILEVNDRINKYADEVSTWIITEKLKPLDPSQVLDPDVAIDVCRAALGLESLSKGVEGEDDPLAPMDENSSGAAG